MKHQIEFELKNPDRHFLDWLFPARNKQAIKRDLRKHCSNKYYNLSLRKKLELIKFWGKILKTN